MNDYQNNDEYINENFDPVKNSTILCSFDTLFIWLTSCRQFPSLENSRAVWENMFYKKNQNNDFSELSLGQSKIHDGWIHYFIWILSVIEDNIWILTPTLSKHITHDKGYDLSFQNRLSMINYTCVLHVIKSISFSLSFIIQFFFGNLADDASIDPSLSIFHLYLFFFLYWFKICLVQKYFDWNIFYLNQTLRIDVKLLRRFRIKRNRVSNFLS